MASSFQSVIVKSLVGDLLQIEYDSSKGTEGVLNALVALDPCAYPRSRTHVSFVEDSEEKFAIVVVDALSFARLIKVHEITFGTDPYTVFHFESEIGTMIYVYHLHDNLNLYLDTTICPPDSYCPPTDPYQLRHTYQRTLHQMEYYIQTHFFSISAYDTYVISEVLKKYLPSRLTPDCFYRYMYRNKQIPFKDRKLVCSCGHIVEHGKLAAHCKTKLKHIHGDEKGKAFMERVAEYVASLP